MRTRTPLVLVAYIRLGRGADRVVVESPRVDDDLGLAQSVENLAVEQLIAKAGIEALDVAVLPGAAPLDVGGLGTDSRDPVLHRLGDELRSVVGADVSGNAAQDEEVGQNVDHIEAMSRARMSRSTIGFPPAGSIGSGRWPSS